MHFVLDDPNTTTPVCTHERTHGTTVCLRCRHEARLAARARRQRMFARAGVVSFVALLVVTAGALGTTAVRHSHLEAARQRQVTVERVVVSSTTPAPDAPTSTTRAVQQGEVVQHAAPSTATPSAPGAHVAPVTPVIPLGATPFADSLEAVRSDSDVVLLFDTELARTRLPDKFEAFVRTTLPMIYGPRMTAALAAIPGGSIAAQGDLLNELPSRGVRIPVAPGWTAVLFPETRPGRDGPLVVRYRVSIVPAR